MVSVGATTHDGALTRQLPELVLELLDEVDELLELDAALDELEVLEELDELEELFDDEPPPQPATVSAPSALNACRREK